MSDNLIEVVKSGLTFLSDVLLGVQQAKDNKSAGASGYAAKAGSDLVDIAKAATKNIPPKD